MHRSSGFYGLLLCLRGFHEEVLRLHRGIWSQLGLLTIAILIPLTGCTYIGHRVGSCIHHEQRYTNSSLPPPGTKVTVLLLQGGSVRGKALGPARVGPDAYARNYAAFRGALDSARALPTPGHSVEVIAHGETTAVTFVGFEHQYYPASTGGTEGRYLCRAVFRLPTADSAELPCDLERIERIEAADGGVVTGGLLAKLDAQVGLPTMSGFRLITGHDTTDVPITEIKAMVRQSDYGRAGMIIGIPLDLLILAAAAAAIAAASGWAPMGSY